MEKTEIDIDVAQVAEEDGLRIVTWNINGLRSLDNFPDWLRRLDADILCFQETKVTRDMLTEPLAIVPGYTSYYSFSRNRSGYSGVATYVRSASTPVAAEEGVTGFLAKGQENSVGGTDLMNIEFSQEEMKSLDVEGRCVITKHQIESPQTDHLVIINVYCPRADPDREDRKRFKLMFYKAVDIRANSLLVQGCKVIVVGDINTSHRELDHCDPYEEFHDHPGRRFLTHFLYDEERPQVEDPQRETEDWECTNVQVSGNMFLDAFRIFHSDREMAFTCWNTKMNCRSTNYGTRIDYIFASKDLQPSIRSCDIHPEIEGSDHCPVSAIFNFSLQSACKIPVTATKFFPEFQGKQLKIKELFANTKKRERSPEKPALKVPVKKSKQCNSKITNFFAPKTLRVEENATPDDLVTEDLSYGCKVSTQSSTLNNGESKAAWGKLFKPPPPAPTCFKHKEECVKRRVTKKGSNQGREFYVCRRGEGRADDPNAKCDYFKWAK